MSGSESFAVIVILSIGIIVILFMVVVTVAVFLRGNRREVKPRRMGKAQEPLVTDPVVAAVPTDRWKNRRRLACTAMAGLVMTVLFFGLFAVVGPDAVFDRLSKVEMILSTVLIGLVSIVGAYVGFATMDDMKKK